MSQPVKLSDDLVLDARLTSEVAERSIADRSSSGPQLGRALEPLLTGDQAFSLRRSGEARPLSECVASVDTPEGRKLVEEHLEKQPFPHYETG